MSENACSWQHLCQQGEYTFAGYIQNAGYSLECIAFRGQLKQSIHRVIAFWSTELVYQSDHRSATDWGGGGLQQQKFVFPLSSRLELQVQGVGRLVSSEASPFDLQMAVFSLCLDMGSRSAIHVQISLSYKNNDYLQAVNGNHPTPLPETSIQQHLLKTFYFSDTV